MYESTFYLLTYLIYLLRIIFHQSISHYVHFIGVKVHIEYKDEQRQTDRPRQKQKGQTFQK